MNEPTTEGVSMEGSYYSPEARKARLDGEFRNWTVEELANAPVDMRGVRRDTHGIYRTCFSSIRERENYIASRESYGERLSRQQEENAVKSVAGNITEADRKALRDLYRSH